MAWPHFKACFADFEPILESGTIIHLAEGQAERFIAQAKIPRHLSADCFECSLLRQKWLACSRRRDNEKESSVRLLPLQGQCGAFRQRHSRDAFDLPATLIRVEFDRDLQQIRALIDLSRLSPALRRYHFSFKRNPHRKRCVKKGYPRPAAWRADGGYILCVVNNDDF